MAKYTFLLFYEYMLDLKNKSYIIHLEKYELQYIMLVDARGVTINLAHEMRLNTETWFTRMREYFNILFLRNFQLQNICLLITKCSCILKYFN